MIEALLIFILGAWNVHLGTELMEVEQELEALHYSDIYEQYARETDVCDLKYSKQRVNLERCHLLAYAKFCALTKAADGVGECE